MSKNNQTKAFGSVTGVFGFSRLLGFGRELVLSRLLGATAWFDAFVVAIRVPTYAVRIFESSLNYSLIPALEQALQLKEKAAVSHLASVFATRLLPLLFIFAVILWFGSEYVASALLLGKSTQQVLFAAELLQVTSLVVIFGVIAPMLCSILYFLRSFFLAAFSNLFTNLCLLPIALYFLIFDPAQKQSAVYALAMGLSFSFVLQSIFLFLNLRRKKFLLTLDFSKPDTIEKRALKSVAPIASVNALIVLGSIITLELASYLEEGSLSIIYLAQRFNQLPAGIISLALSIVLLPFLTRYFGVDKNQMQSTAAWGQRTTLCLGIAATAGLVALGTEISIVFFEGGQFDALASEKLGLAITVLAFAMPAQMLSAIHLPSFFSVRNIKTPLIIIVLCLILQLSLALVGLLVFDLGFISVVIAEVIASLVQFMALRYQLVKAKLIYSNWGGWKKVFIIFFSGLMLFLSIELSSPDAMQWRQMGAFAQITLLLSFVGIGAVAYLCLLWLLGIRISWFYPEITQDKDQAHKL